MRDPQRGIDRAAEVSLRFANGTLAHISVSITHAARSNVLLTGTDGEIECLGTLGADGAGTILHRTADSLRGLLQGPAVAERPIAFVAEDPYLRQLRAFVARCGEGPHEDRCPRGHQHRAAPARCWAWTPVKNDVATAHVALTPLLRVEPDAHALGRMLDPLVRALGLSLDAARAGSRSAR